MSNTTNTKTVSLAVKTLADLKKLEKVSSEASEQYVPISTTKIIQDLSPEFKFISANRVFPISSRHEVILQHGNDYILIENSYDRSRSFRLSFLSNGVLIPLDLEKVVHRGEFAKNLEQDILVNKDKVIEALHNAKTVVTTLKNSPITDKYKTEITNIVFEKHIKKGFKVDVGVIASRYENFFDYGATLAERLIDGAYYYENDKGKLRRGRKIKSRFLQLEAVNKVIKYLKDNNPAVFI